MCRRLKRRCTKGIRRIPTAAADLRHKKNKNFFKKVLTKLSLSSIIIIEVKERVSVKIMKLQVTLFATNGKYRPISTIINVESMEDYEQNKRKYQEKAILNICHNRRTTWKELKQDSYTKIKVREYDKEKINLQAKKELLKRLFANYKEKKEKM